MAGWDKYMPNAKYKLDPRGSYVKSDPFLESITKPKTPIAKATEPTVKVIGSEESLGIGRYAPKPTPTPTPTPTPATEAAARPLTAPKVAPVAKPAVRPIQTAEGDVIANFNRYLSRKPNETELAEFMRLSPQEVESRLKSAQQDAYKLGEEPTEELPPSPTDLAIKPLEDEEEVEDEKPKVEDPWVVPEVDEILKDMGIETTDIHDYTEDYQDLIDWQTEELEKLELEYERRYEEQNKADKNSLSALQAKLLKAGVSLDGTSFQSATAGEVARAEARIKALEREEALAEARINSSYLKNKRALGKEERDEVWNAKVFDYDNIFKGKGIQKDMWTMFNERDQFERQQEQDEQQHLENLNLEYYKMDEKQRSEGLGRVQSNLEKGLYDMYNEDDVNLLYGLEDKYGLETGELTTPALAGYWKRMNNYFLTQAKTAKTEAETEYKETQTAKMKAKTLSAGLEAEEGGYPKGFWSAVRNSTGEFQKGVVWEVVFDRMKEQFPSVPDENLNKLLGGSWDAATGETTGWATPGAFEEWKSKQYKEDRPTEAEKKSDIWKEISANPDTPDDVIKQWIMGEGFNPEDFGYY